MGQLIKRFTDNSILEYDRGKFDDWCVYYTDTSGRRRPPRDYDYFGELKSFARKYGNENIYNDYVCVYNLTEKSVNEKVLAYISEITKKYHEDALRLDVLMSILYMGMIAEERKINTRLGKRIKRLGMHKLLIEGETISSSANFMRGMNWREIDRMCRERNF